MNINEIIAVIDAPDPMGMPPIMALPANIAKLSADDKLAASTHYAKLAYEIIKKSDLKTKYENVRCSYYDGYDAKNIDDQTIVSLDETEKMLLMASALTTSGTYNNSQEEAKIEFEATEKILAAVGIVFTDAGKASFDELVESINTGQMTKTYALYQDIFNVYSSLEAFPQLNELKANLLRCVLCLHSIGDKEKNMRKVAISSAFMSF